MNLIWSPNSRHDLQSIYQFVAQNNPRAANEIVLQIVDAVEKQLAPFPLSGRLGRVDGTRELVIARTPYIVVYRAAGSVVEIAAVIHAARRWPDSF